MKKLQTGSIEVDSMGDATGNFVTGETTDVGKLRTGQPILNLSVSNLEPNRFENGRIVITRTDANGNTVQVASRRVVSSSANGTANTASSVTIVNNLTFTLQQGDQFTLYDDDDMDDDDVGSLNGDDGDDVPEPDIDLLQNSDLPANNVLAPAYVRPQCCLSGSHQNVPFVASPTYADLQTELGSTYFQNFITEASKDFWTIYLLGGYQPPQYDPNLLTLIRDGDPVVYSNSLPIVIATIYGASNSGSIEATSTSLPTRNNNGQGAILFTEVGRPNEYPNAYETRPISRAYTVAYEVGHLFRGVHIDGDLMAPSASRTVGTFSDISLKIIRETTNP